ncbi:glycosyltransferase [Mariniflexile ostreae]|uniref:Glycosyltransferase n=1 Tax=Mariniflexile ostreae TaxID=1520892 RepID=A0ABV5FC93_9FLAO
MKILCVIDSLGSGGAQRQLVELAKGFKEKGHEVQFLVYHDYNFFEQDLIKSQISITLIPESNYFKRLIKMRRFIRDGDFNGIISFLEGANFISTVAGFPFKKWKLVVGERSANPKILTSFKLRFYRWFHVFSDHVVANSQANLDMVKKANPLLRNKKCAVIYNFTTMGEVALTIPKNQKLVITVPASYRNVKNTEGLVEGINLLTENHKKKLIINWYGSIETKGGKAYYNKVSKKIKEYKLEDVIHLNEASTDIANIYKNSDFIALLSHFEGFPNVISEAMTIGRPVIVTKVSDIPIFVKENENGFLCDSTNTLSIKNAFEKAIETTEKERNIMGLNNLEKAKTLFDKDKIVNAYLTLLK